MLLLVCWRSKNLTIIDYKKLKLEQHLESHDYKINYYNYTVIIDFCQPLSLLWNDPGCEEWGAMAVKKSPRNEGKIKHSYEEVIWEHTVTSKNWGRKDLSFYFLQKKMWVKKMMTADMKGTLALHYCTLIWLYMY